MQMMKVFALMTGLTVLLVVAGDYLGGPSMALGMLVLAVIMNVGAYWFSDRAVLKMYRAKVIGPDDAPELYTMVDRLRSEANLPMPTIAIAPSEQPNAFATGRNPDHAAVAITQGLVDRMNWYEIRGVLAHELMHIRNRDILIGSVAAAIGMAITMIARMAMFAAMFSGGRGRGRNPIGQLALAILAPIAALVIQTAISRSREFQADASAARLMGDGEPLALALEKLEVAAARIPSGVNPSQASSYIVDPLKAQAAGGRRRSRLFSTHPSTEDRVARLRGGSWRSGDTARGGPIS